MLRLPPGLGVNCRRHFNGREAKNDNYPSGAASERAEQRFPRQGTGRGAGLGCRDGICLEKGIDCGLDPLMVTKILIQPFHPQAGLSQLLQGEETSVRQELGSVPNGTRVQDRYSQILTEYPKPAPPGWA